MKFDPTACPILIIERDRVTPLRLLVEWLEAAGHQRIVIIDNASTFAPLLEYYEQCPHEVIRLESNVGPYAVWDLDLGCVAPNEPFVVTDSDVVPDGDCPTDAVDRFAELLFRFSDVDKVGFGLRIDDLPSTYKFRDDVIRWESHFWHDEIEPGVFRADIDTTFALYRSSSVSHSFSALRTGPPYIARHLGWYSDSCNLTEEELYYQAHASREISNWDLDELPHSLSLLIKERERVHDVHGATEYLGDEPDGRYNELEQSLRQEKVARIAAEREIEALTKTLSYRFLAPVRQLRSSKLASVLLGPVNDPTGLAGLEGEKSSVPVVDHADSKDRQYGPHSLDRLKFVATASSRAETHARHRLDGGPPFSLDSALHVSRYAWAMEHFVERGSLVVDLGCGTGFGVELLSEKSKRVVGVDLDPDIVGLTTKLGLDNAAFFCDNACLPGLNDRIGVKDADVILSMETIEHLEDYFSYIENAIAMLAPKGCFIVGTPNRTMTYERYPERRHMDPSHVQEFTPTSLEHTLGAYFSSVELYFQSVPGFWEQDSSDDSSRARRDVDGRFELGDVSFQLAFSNPELVLDAFALMALCREPLT